MAEPGTDRRSAGGRARSRADAVELTRVAALGAFAVETTDGRLAETDLGNRKARVLLKLLVARRPGHVPMDTIVDVLWPEGAPAKAVENVATLASRLRGKIGKDVIEGGRSGYQLVVPDGCVVDVDEAEALVREAESRLDGGQPALAVTAAAQALELLDAGPGMQDESHPGEWLETFRREIGRLVRRARVAGWRANAGIGEYRRALALAEDAIAADRFDEEAHRAVMLAYHQLAEPGAALAAYGRARSALVDGLGADPGAETEALYLAILRDEDIGEHEAQAGAVAAGPTVVGRDEEMAALIGAWEQALGGHPACVVVTGESGIGKTHLVGALTQEIRVTGATTVLTRCYGSEQSLFLQPMAEVLRELSGTLPAEVVADAVGSHGPDLVGLAPEFGPHAKAPEPSGRSPEMERRRIFEAVASFLAGLAANGPLLVVLDDVHNAGASTLELVHFTLRWARSVPIMFVLTTHPDDSVEAQLPPIETTVPLGLLDETAVRQLAEDAGHGERAAELMRLTKGHPLFVLEALRAVSDSGEVVVPDTLRDAVIARVRRCGAEVEEFLRGAVVVGTVFDVASVAELLGLTVQDAVRRGEHGLRAGLLSEAGAGYEFANDIIRDVLYETTPEPTRVLRHRRLAQLFHDQPEAAAEHAAAADDWGRAIDRWLAAADRALSAFANREAVGLLGRALDACPLVGDPAATARAQLLRARAFLGQARYDDAAGDLSAVRALARAMGDVDLEAASLEELAWCAYYARQIDRARTLVNQALDQDMAGPRIRILSGRLHNTSGALELAVAELEPITTHGDPPVRASALSCLGTALAHSDRFSDAIGVLDDAVAACELAGLPRPMFNASFFRTVTRANLGDLGGALDAADRLLADVDRFEDDAYKPRAQNALSFLWRELGEPERARDLAEEALERSRMPDGHLEAEPTAHARLALAESHLQTGDGDEAMRWLGELAGAHLPDVAFAWRVELHRLEALARLDPTWGEELLAQARRYESAKYQTLALAHLGRERDAVELARATGSDLLVAHVAPDAEARAAAERIAAGLPDDHHRGFLERGRWRSARKRRAPDRTGAL